MTLKLFTGKRREGDNFETKSRAGKFIHSKQRRKWSHNFGKKKMKMEVL
jgi:hypothetical protein